MRKRIDAQWNAVVEHSESAAHHRIPLPKWIPCRANSRRQPYRVCLRLVRHAAASIQGEIRQKFPVILREQSLFGVSYLKRSTSSKFDSLDQVVICIPDLDWLER